MSALWFGAWARPEEWGRCGGELGEGPDPKGATAAGPLRPAPLPVPNVDGGPPKWGAVAVPPAVGFVEGSPSNGEALGDLLQRRKHPLAVRPRGGPVEEAFHEDVLQPELA